MIIIHHVAMLDICSNKIKKFHSQPINGIKNYLKGRGFKEDMFYNSKAIKDLEKFKSMSDIIATNRLA